VKSFPRLPPRLACVFPSNPVYFVTACTYRRRALLTTDAVNHAFEDFAERAYSKHNIAVGRYVIMPDHIHLFVCGPDNFELRRWIGLLKQCLAKSVVRAPSCRPSLATRVL
jgi:putative transposase